MKAIHKSIHKSKEKVAENGIYIYGIVPNFYGAEHFRSLEKANVYAIPLQNVSAIVSDVEREPVAYLNMESTGKTLEQYHNTIEQIIALGFYMILPMKPGTYVNTRQEILTILAKGHDLFISSFNQIENMIELDLTVSWIDFKGLLKDLSSHPEIIELRDSIMKRDGSFSQADHVKTGMLVREKLNEKNKLVEMKILNVLTSFSTNLKLHEVLDDQVISNAAFMIKRNLKDKFIQTVGQFNEEYSGLLNFNLTGPLPCYSFYTIEVKELSPEQVDCAKKELGLNEEPLELVVKRAYLNYARLFHPEVNQDNGVEERFKRIRMAYNTLLEYSMAVKQSSEIESTSLINEKTIQKMFLVKVKD
jgi:hypothetical protein